MLVSRRKTVVTRSHRASLPVSWKRLVRVRAPDGEGRANSERGGEVERLDRRCLIPLIVDDVDLRLLADGSLLLGSMCTGSTLVGTCPGRRGCVLIKLSICATLGGTISYGDPPTTISSCRAGLSSSDTLQIRATTTPSRAPGYASIYCLSPGWPPLVSDPLSPPPSSDHLCPSSDTRRPIPSFRLPLNSSSSGLASLLQAGTDADGYTRARARPSIAAHPEVFSNTERRSFLDQL